MSFRTSLFVLIITLLSWIEGHPSERRTFWSKIYHPDYSHIHRINDGNLKGFSFLPFSTIIRKPMGKQRTGPKSSGKEEGDAVRHLFQRLGFLLVKGNAALMLNRIPSFPLPEIDGDL